MELQLVLQSLTILEDKLHNGISGTAMLNNLKNNKSKMKNKNNMVKNMDKDIIHQEHLKVVDILLHLKDV